MGRRKVYKVSETVSVSSNGVVEVRQRGERTYRPVVRTAEQRRSIGGKRAAATRHAQREARGVRKFPRPPEDVDCILREIATSRRDYKRRCWAWAKAEAMAKAEAAAAAAEEAEAEYVAKFSKAAENGDWWRYDGATGHYERRTTLGAVDKRTGRASRLESRNRRHDAPGQVHVRRNK